MSNDPAVLLARARKKVSRLIVQRDHWKREYGCLHEVLDNFPQIRRERDKYNHALAERARVSALEARVKEQAALIELMRKEQAK